MALIVMIVLAALLAATALRAQTQAPATGAAPPAAPPAESQPAPRPKSDQPPPLEPAEKVLPEVTANLAKLTDIVARAEKTIDRVRTDEKQLSAIRTELEKAIDTLDDLEDSTKPQIGALSDQLSRLGPPPPSTATEPADIARERARLQDLSAKFAAAARSTDLARTRAEQLIARIRALRQSIFAKNLFQRDPTPLGFEYWKLLAQDLPATSAQIESIAADWWASLKPRWLELLLLVPLALLSVILLSILRTRMVNAMTPALSSQAPFYHRAKVALASVPVLALPPAALLALLYAVAMGLELVPEYMTGVVTIALGAALIFVLVKTLAAAILSPSRPQWGLAGLPPGKACRLAFLVDLAALAFLLDVVFSEISRSLYLAPPIAIGLKFLTNIAAALPLFGIVFTAFAPPTAQPLPASILWPRWLKLPILATAVAIVIMTAAGYLAFGHFLMGQLILTAAVVAFAVIFHCTVSSYIVNLRPEPEIDDTHGADTLQQTELQLRRQRLFNSAIVTTLDAVLVAAALPVLLLTWGFSTSDIQAGAKAAILGFEIGEFRISLARIALALALFAAVLFLTRFVQRALQNWLEGASPSEIGVGNSIQTFIGYVGTTVAALAALSYAGFDITNLAIVAGALSVGIGFGLQSIVNNFVSGLILLFERPVKVGDWVVVNGNEGYIRRISVRATEIETFDRSSIIIPNSEFITSSVVNWTHRNALGRGIVRVGVSYEADPEQVREVLLSVATKSKLVLAHPAPVVVFEAFGASSLDFSLRVYLADVNKRLSAMSELRMEVFKALKQAGVAIPYPQTDVHLRDLDPVREALAALAARARQNDPPGVKE